MAHKGLDCYLDSLFDPVLSYGDAVGTQQGICRPQHSVCTEEPLSARVVGWRILSGSLLGVKQRMRVSLQLEVLGRTHSWGSRTHWERAPGHPCSLWELPGAPPRHNVKP